MVKRLGLPSFLVLTSKKSDKLLNDASKVFLIIKYFIGRWRVYILPTWRRNVQTKILLWYVVYWYSFQHISSNIPIKAFNCKAILNKLNRRMYIPLDPYTKTLWNENISFSFKVHLTTIISPTTKTLNAKWFRINRALYFKH